MIVTDFKTFEWRTPVVLLAGARIKPGAVPAVEVPCVVVGEDESIAHSKQIRNPGVEPSRPDLDDIRFLVDVSGNKIIIG